MCHIYVPYIYIHKARKNNVIYIYRDIYIYTYVIVSVSRCYILCCRNYPNHTCWIKPLLAGQAKFCIVLSWMHPFEWYPKRMGVPNKTDQVWIWGSPCLETTIFLRRLHPAFYDSHLPICLAKQQLPAARVPKIASWPFWIWLWVTAPFCFRHELGKNNCGQEVCQEFFVSQNLPPKSQNHDGCPLRAYRFTMVHPTFWVAIDGLLNRDAEGLKTAIEAWWKTKTIISVLNILWFQWCSMHSKIW